MDKKGKTITGIVIGVVVIVALVLGLTFGLRSCDNEEEDDLVTETEGGSGSSSTDNTKNNSTSGSGSSSTDGTTNNSTSSSGNDSHSKSESSTSSSSGNSSSSSSESSHTHSYVTKYTSEGHYQECTSCGETTSLVPHDLVYSDNVNGLALHDSFGSTGSHHVECSFCGYNYDEAHDYCEDHWMSDGTSHWHECEECHSKETSSISTHSFTNFVDDHDGQHHHEECSICHYGCDEDHDFDLDNGEVITPATCTGSGLMACTCLECGAVENVEIPALGHLYSETSYESNEYGHYQICLRCGESSSSTSHIYSPAIACDDCCHQQTCLVCGYVSTNSHQWDEGYVETAATCTSEGKIIYHCTACSATSEVPIAALGHDPLDTYSSDASGHWHACTRCNEKLDFEAHSNVCISNGDTHYEECTICSYKSTEEYHSWDDGVETTSPTCTEKGIMTYTCESCGATKEEYIEPLGHNYDTNYSTDAYGHYYKCLNEGCTSRADYEEHDLGGYSFNSEIHYQECPTCHYIALEEDHNWDEGEEIVSATCTTDGVKTYTCLTCNATKEATISALGHTNKTTYSSNNSSTHTKMVTCSVCGNTTTTSESHTTTSTSSTTNCTTTTTTTCTYCGYSTSSSTTSHSSTTTSYSSNGSSTHTVTVKCSKCGTTLSTSTASHTTTTSTSTSGCTTTTKKTCTYCGYSTSSSTTSHTNKTTYSSNGSSTHTKTVTCSVCGNTTTTSESHTTTSTTTYSCNVSVGSTSSAPKHSVKVTTSCTYCSYSSTSSSSESCTLVIKSSHVYYCSVCGATYSYSASTGVGYQRTS